MTDTCFSEVFSCYWHINNSKSLIWKTGDVAQWVCGHVQTTGSETFLYVRKSSLVQCTVRGRASCRHSSPSHIPTCWRVRLHEHVSMLHVCFSATPREDEPTQEILQHTDRQTLTVPCWTCLERAAHTWGLIFITAVSQAPVSRLFLLPLTERGQEAMVCVRNMLICALHSRMFKRVLRLWSRGLSKVSKPVMDKHKRHSLCFLLCHFNPFQLTWSALWVNSLENKHTHELKPCSRSPVRHFTWSAFVDGVRDVLIELWLSQHWHEHAVLTSYCLCTHSHADVTPLYFFIFSCFYAHIE